MLDSNVLLSRLLWPPSLPAQVVGIAFRRATVLISDALVAELAEVLARPKLARYVQRQDAEAFVHALGGVAERVALTAHVEACRDPRDDHILALAVSGSANLIVTGDRDLLALHPFRSIGILTPRQFLERAA